MYALQYTVRSISEPVDRYLRKLAQQNGKSLNQVVIAESRYGFVNGNQAEKNEVTLQRFLAQPQVSVLLPTLQTTNYYALIQLHCKQHGNVLSQNDILDSSFS